MNASTLDKFVNLKKLNLSQTNLQNFDFQTFYQQRNLTNLDLSHNHLKRVDFHLFLRNFEKLSVLNLEGNNLTELDSVTRSHFPMLSLLGISRNNFTCDYLVEFLLQWPNLKLIDNPANQIHIGGVDCVHRNLIKDHGIADFSSEHRLVDSDKHLTELSTIKYLLSFIGIVLIIIVLLAMIYLFQGTMRKCKTHFNEDSTNDLTIVYHSKNHINNY